MTDLLHITEPGGARPSPQWQAFLELGFRPLYLAGCFWAAFSIALWVYAPQLLAATLPGVLWHAHEMLWAFIATIAVGFLLTAASNWTGVNPLRGLPLGILLALWSAARIGYLVHGALAFWVAACSELAFFAWAAAALGRAIVGARNRRNYGLPLLVLGLGVADALYLLAALQGDYALLLQRLNAGLLCMAVIALLVARRVIPFFAMRAIPGLTIPMHTRSGQWQIGAGVIAVFGSLLRVPTVTAAALAAAGCIALFQVLAWRPWATRRTPLLWILYVGYAALGAGLLVAAAHAMGWIVRAAWPVHVIGVAGFSVLIIGMVTRTALGHLGRPLQTDHAMVISYALVILAAALRLVALLPTDIAPDALHASAAAWLLAFVLYLWRFFPMMIRPRADRAVAPAALRTSR
ncbi:NnrS family protein [Variovorax sp. J22P240]|uniref:NnrS family protein n=1 Tax=Variovorax sp. J22P240 TaxID=3053514 RepID=UPI002576A393|nr:NnrS family protein [Variovorax sp. J22P240]MDM0001120.1 NnrS family protein [Variovorax sp. J22P240]